MDKKTKQLHNLLAQLQKHKFTHNYARNYYDKLNFRLIIPSITITGLSSIASFLASSNILPSEYRNYMNLSIGIFTSFSSIMQSIVSSCGFETRKETFKKADKVKGELHFNETLVKNKKVAIVGPSPHLVNTGLGQYIDSHDLVIRINEILPSGYFQDYGSKTDIVFLNLGNDWLEITIEMINNLMFKEKNNPDLLKKVLNLDALSLEWREKFQKRI